MRIQIWLDSTDPPTGRVGDQDDLRPFRGWIDLLAVLAGVLDASRDIEGDLRPRAQLELGEDV